MKKIKITKEEFKELDFFYKPGVLQTECFIYTLYKGKNKYCDNSVLIKIFHNNQNIDEKISNIEQIRKAIKDTDINEFVLPFGEVYIDEELKALAMEKVENSSNLGLLLNGEDTNTYNNLTIIKKIEYLAKIGKLLKKVKALEDIDFFFGDLHEYNFLINNITEELKVIDMDGVCINNSTPTGSFYLDNDNLKFFNKYKFNKSRIIIPSRNTDLYCYNAMVIRSIAENRVYKMNIKDYNNYLLYLTKLGYSSDIIKAFRSIYSEEDNINSVDYFDGIPVNDLEKMKLSTINSYQKIIAKTK